MIIKPSQKTIDESYVKNYDEIYKQAVNDPEGFWANIAEELSWFKKWDKVLDWKYPYASWFVGAQCNIIYNALDRHQKNGNKDKIAILWEGQDKTTRSFTYAQLNDEVSRLANVLKSKGIKKGDHVCIYMPRLPEQTISMLACAKIGAIHTVVYSGFSVEALKNRITDAEAKLILTSDGYYFREKLVNTKQTVDDAIKDLPDLKSVIVVKRAGNPINMQAGRDEWYSDLVSKADNICSTEIMDANDPLFILYTSGTTGKPKGIVHAHGGYMVGIYITLKWVFNLQPNEVYWCTADPGWITGHSYIVYSPLMNGITSFIYEGPPDYPDPGKWWSLIEKYKISTYYTTPTAVRALMKYGDEIPNKFNLSSLRMLGSVGEPINPEAFMWFYKVIGKEKCPIMDTWWQTETGAHMITPLPTVDVKPGSCFKPFPGIVADIVDEKGNPVPPNTEGYLIIRTPWPSMFKDVFKNPEKYKEAYWEKIPNVYFVGDSAKKDEDGYYWIIGRNDDVMKVSGYRFGSAEIESAFVADPKVAEAAAIGKPHPVKGESIKVFVILKSGVEGTDDLKKELRQKVRELIGPIAMPDEVEFVQSLPKTRSGKIMRRVLKAQELGLPVGDTSTLEN